MRKLFIILTLITGLQAHAGLITITSDQSTSEMGDTVMITLTGHDLDPFYYFELDFVFDTNIYAYSSDSLTSDLALFNEVFPSEGLRASPITNSGIFLDFYQFDEFISANSEFILAKFALTTIDTGQTTFSLINNFFAGFNGVIDARSGHELQTTVTNSSIKVAEPKSLGILLIGFLLLMFRNNQV